jgi:hypothetical protein
MNGHEGLEISAAVHFSLLSIEFKRKGADIA